MSCYNKAERGECLGQLRTEMEKLCPNACCIHLTDTAGTVECREYSLKDVNYCSGSLAQVHCARTCRKCY